MKKHILFVCSRNKLRSRTAHDLFRHREDIEVDSAGTESDAYVVVESDHVEWADVIYVMEARHAKRLKEMFGRKLMNKKIINLNIPDIYDYMDPALVRILTEKLRGLG